MTELASGRVWRVCVEIPEDNDLHDELFDVIADAAYKWEERFDTRNFDVNVYAVLIDVEDETEAKS